MKLYMINKKYIILILFILIVVILFNCININESFIDYDTIDLNIKANTNNTKIAIVSVMKNPIDLPLWLAYHRKLGIQRFYIRLEDSPIWKDYLKKQDDVILETDTSDISTHVELIGRQIDYVNRTIESIRETQDIDWLFHIDSDELLNGNIFFVNNLSEDIYTIKLQNAEAIYDEKDNKSCFSANKFLLCNKGAPCTAYVNGKAGGRPLIDGVHIDGVHDFSYKNEIDTEHQYNVPFEVLHVLHFESCSFESWIGKFLRLRSKEGASIPFPFYLESIEAAANAYDLYKKNKMPNIDNIEEKYIYQIKKI